MTSVAFRSGEDSARLGSVYLLRFPGKTHKMYVGYDRNCSEGSKRYTNHLKAARCEGGFAIHAAVKKYGPPTKTILFRSSNVSLLKFIESEMIDALNTLSPHGYNLTTGGEGGKLSKESRAKLSTKRRAFLSDPAERERIGASMRQSPLAKAQRDVQLAALNADPEYRAKRLAQLAALNASPEHQAHLAALHARLRANPDENPMRNPEVAAKVGAKRSAYLRSNPDRNPMKNPATATKAGASISTTMLANPERNPMKDPLIAAKVLRTCDANHVTKYLARGDLRRAQHHAWRDDAVTARLVADGVIVRLPCLFSRLAAELS